MSMFDGVILIPRVLRADDRGWFLKVIDGTEAHLPSQTGEVYLTMAAPGQTRGNHYHAKTAEWFTVVAGRANVILANPDGGESEAFVLEASDPHTLYVPAGIAHAFTNPIDAKEGMLLVAYTDRLFDPADTIPLMLQ